MGRRLSEHSQQPFELEVSVDERETPTSPAEHLFIASELRRLGVRWVSLAPRFVGRFEKGVDYIGDLDAFEAECREAGQEVPVAEMMQRIAGCGPRPAMLEAIGRIRRRGIAVAALTNNWAGEEDRTGEIRDHFDAFVESSAVGLRKPDPRIYLLACESLAIEPAEAVFLDDIGRNLKIARELGMKTIKVDQPEKALQELSNLLGFPLL